MKKKIDIFIQGKYYKSTVQFNTCKEVKERFLKLFNLDIQSNGPISRQFPSSNLKDVKCCFDHLYKQ